MGTLGGRRDNKWLVVQNLPAIFNVFEITGHCIRWEVGDFVAINVGDFKGIYIRLIPLNSYVFVFCVAIPMRSIAAVDRNSNQGYLFKRKS